MKININITKYIIKFVEKDIKEIYGVELALNDEEILKRFASSLESYIWEWYEGFMTNIIYHCLLDRHYILKHINKSDLDWESINRGWFLKVSNIPKPYSEIIDKIWDLLEGNVARHSNSTFKFYAVQELGNVAIDFEIIIRCHYKVTDDDSNALSFEYDFIEGYLGMYVEKIGKYWLYCNIGSLISSLGILVAGGFDKKNYSCSPKDLVEDLLKNFSLFIS